MMMMIPAKLRAALRAMTAIVTMGGAAALGQTFLGIFSTLLGESCH
jgi:hypothetical protein